MHSGNKHCYCMILSLKVKVIAKIKATALGSNKHTDQKQNKQEICPVSGVQLVCQICCVDLLTIPERGQQRSRVIK